MKKIASLLLLWVMALPLMAQFQEPVKFSVSQNKLSDSEFELVFTGTVDPGWHVYSTDIPDGGPTPATITFDEQTGVEPAGKLTAKGNVHKAFDELGVKKIATVGVDFNPKYHEAAAHEASDEVPEGKIIREWSGGFTLGERLLRPARVVVSSGPAPQETTESEEQKE